MSAILKTQLQSTATRAKNYTNSEILTYVSAISSTLTSHNSRITTLENNSDSGYFYLDNDGDICQSS